VLSSEDPRFQAGDRVVLNGYGLGEVHHGGYAERARVKGDWLIRLPENISTGNAMAIGTAGYTAMLCVLALEKAGITPDRGDVLVTGAAGGVGSVAIALLDKLGYRVVAQGDAESDRARQCGEIEDPRPRRARLRRAERTDGPVHPHDRHRPRRSHDHAGKHGLQHETMVLARQEGTPA